MHLFRPLVLALFALPTLALAQRDFSAVEVKSVPLRGGTHVLTGAGGNVVASVGTDGVFIIDDQYAPLTEKIVAALAKLGDTPPRFVINTHWHGDHTGGNENLGKAGAVIVAHENVRRRMAAGQLLLGDNVPPGSKESLPVVTFTADVSLHLNGDDVRVSHVAHAHTDGDALVKFDKANVLHMGDIYFNGLYPFIDTESGGDIDGFLKAIDRGLALSDADTLVVPGHGPVSNRAELEAYGKLYRDYRDRIAALKRDGKTLDEVVALKPTEATDEKLGKTFIKPAQLIASIYNTL